MSKRSRILKELRHKNTQLELAWLSITRRSTLNRCIKLVLELQERETKAQKKLAKQQKKSCGTKKRFSTKEEAIQWRIENSGGRGQSYPCPFCHFYHNGCFFFKKPEVRGPA